MQFEHLSNLMCRLPESHVFKGGALVWVWGRAFIGLLRERGFQVLPGSQNKHFVHGLGAEAGEAETWVN